MLPGEEGPPKGAKRHMGGNRIVDLDKMIT